MNLKLIHRSQIKKGDVYIHLTGRPTQLVGQHSPGLFNMAYVDLDGFPGWVDDEMVALVEKKDQDDDGSSG